MPLEGPFYIVYLNPIWRLVSAPAKDQESSIGHPDLWKDTVVPLLVQHYRNRLAVQGDQLTEACYGVPRGRVCKTGDGYTVWHGRNWGRGVKATWIKKCIVADFQLSGVAGLRWDYDEHYGILDADRTVLNRMGILPPLVSDKVAEALRKHVSGNKGRLKCPKCGAVLTVFRIEGKVRGIECRNPDCLVLCFD